MLVFTQLEVLKYALQFSFSFCKINYKVFFVIYEVHIYT